MATIVAADLPFGHRVDRVTISDVAQAAGVSKTAVSVALNHPERLGKETVRHIRQVVRDLDYTPLASARELSMRRRASRL